jgi:hypothetical protein
MTAAPPLPGDDEDLGEPIRELRDLSLAEPTRFVGSIERRVERRRVTNEFVTVAWHASSTILLALLEATIGRWTRQPRSDAPPPG